MTAGQGPHRTHGAPSASIAPSAHHPGMSGHTFVPDLAAEGPTPPRGILSQTISDEDGVELILFSFAAGERLSEHTSARPAIVHVLSGGAELTVDDETHEAVAGAWLRMPADTRHAILARTPLVMALYLLPRPAAAG
jgi:quercetin dioxygenase-like cupin family protein